MKGKDAIAHLPAFNSRVRNRQELNASLKGATLGDATGDTDDALKWIKKAKKREKELAKKRQEELDSADKAIQDEYSESTSTPLLASSEILTCSCRGSRWPQSQPRFRRDGRR